MTFDPTHTDYLRLLAEQYPTIGSASGRIIELEALLALPKGTEHFISDIHGEVAAFQHVMRNASGSIRRKIEEKFGDELTPRERRHLATLVYYPEQKLPLLLAEVEDEAAWYRLTLDRLLRLARVAAVKYTRSSIRKALPDVFTDQIDELIHQQGSVQEKAGYYQQIVESVIATGQGPAFVAALARLIQRLAVARLHIIGDVFDRGPGAHLIMDELLTHPSIDIQWGNHDIVWMGAAAGSEACMANVVRLSLRYSNVETLEQGYGVSLLPLVSFALEQYADDPCRRFEPRDSPDEEFTENERRLIARMHKAIAIIQFKLEAQVIRRRPHFEMRDRRLLHRIDHERGTIMIDGRRYELVDSHFPTVDPDTPYKLSEGERTVMERLRQGFTQSERLQRHVRFLFSRGRMYRSYNGNLLFHGCIPMEPDGSFQIFRVAGGEYAGRNFLDRVDRLARQGYYATDPERRLYGQDAIWYLWSGSSSPLFGKEKMTTFERYFIDDPAAHTEVKNAYYELRNEESTARLILEEFGLDPEQGHIINGHVPVRVTRGESPVKAGGKLLVIDGGFSKAYQSQTGIAGYTLIFNSYGLLLASHQPFESTRRAIEEEADIATRTEILEEGRGRILVRDTDRGRTLQRELAALHALVDAYREGLIQEA